MASNDKSKAAAAPAVRVTENPFGSFSDEQMAGKPLVDRFYLKGYSDKRHERELAMREREKSTSAPKPEPLAHRFQYVSVMRPDGSADKTKYVEWVAKGYRSVKYDELESLGIDTAGSTAERNTAGDAVVGSQLLMVCDAATAARRFNEQRELTENQAKDVYVSFDEAADKYNAKHGRDAKTGTKTFYEDTETVRKERR